MADSMVPFVYNGSIQKRKRKTIDIREEMEHNCFKMTVEGLDKKPMTYEIKTPSGIKLYSSQRLMILKMLRCYNNRLNSLIESPTGSGKTMALLVATCAWLKDYNRKRMLLKQECPQHGLKRETPPTPSTSMNTSTYDYANSSTSVLDVSENESKDISMASAISEKPKWNTEDFDDDFVEPEPQSKKPHSSLRFQETCEEIDEFCDNSNSTAMPCTCEPRVTVYYGTRTHKQIAQVIKEYSRLLYGQDGSLKHTIFASREHSCINSHIKQMPGDLTTNCKDAINTKNPANHCSYKFHMKPYERPASMRSLLYKLGAEEVWDMENLVDTLSGAKKVAVCPYFASNRVLALDADIVFTPFNYILDPIIRNSSEINVKNSIIIFDEGHNVEDVSRDAASFSFKESDIVNALIHINKRKEQLEKNKEDDPLTRETMQNNEGFKKAVIDMKIGLERIDAFYRAFHEWFRALGRDPSLFDKNTKTFTWEDLSESLRNSIILVGEKNKKNERYCELENAISAVMLKTKDEIFVNEYVQNLLGPFCPQGFAIIPLEKFLQFSDFYSKHDYKNAEAYRCNISFVSPQRDELSTNTANKTRFSTSGKSRAKSQFHDKHTHDEYESNIWKYDIIRSGFDAILNLWCMIPSIAFMDAVSEARSVILASGTLCPTDTLETELDLDFKQNMVGQQIIPKEQIFKSIVVRGPSNVTLNAVYRNIPNEFCPFISELAAVILRTCQIVPKGVLCFLSSYRILNLLEKYFQNNNKQWLELKKVKQVCIEPRRTVDLANVMQEYEDAVTNPSWFGAYCTGALMLAVFRGKVSEGIDFTDDKARCVICVGIPFPNALDEQVIEKKKYNNEHSRTSNMINGDDWYVTQAYRALNQALGRCLRHINDWGALLLVDERFSMRKNSQNQKEYNKISAWVRDGMIAYDNFLRLEHNLKKFVELQEERCATPQENVEPIKEELPPPPPRINGRKNFLFK